MKMRIIILKPFLRHNLDDVSSDKNIVIIHVEDKRGGDIVQNGPAV